MSNAYLRDFHLFIQIRLNNIIVNKRVSLIFRFTINHQNTPVTHNGGSKFFIPTIRALLALDAAYKLQVYQMDVKTAFLNGELDDEIYMQ